MQWTRKITKIGGSMHISIPTDLVDYLDLQAGDVVTIQDDNGNHGKFISMWKK